MDKKLFVSKSLDFMKFLPIILSLAIVGCSDGQPHLFLEEFEFQSTLPNTTTIQEQIALEKTLKDQGYTRVVFRAETYSLRSKPSEIIVYATRRLPPETEVRK